MLFDEVRIQADVKKTLSWCSLLLLETVCPCKTQVGTLFPMKGILLSMLKFHAIIDRGVNVGNDL